MSLSWNGHIAEWALHGVSTKIVERSILASGVENTLVPLSFHVTRKSVYYFWKALLPLYLLTALSMTTFQFETDNLEARLLALELPSGAQPSGKRCQSPDLSSKIGPEGS